MLDRHRAARQRVRVGQEGVGKQQQVAVERPQVGPVQQRMGVEQVGIHALVAGAQHGIDQRARLRVPGGPHGLEPVVRVELLQQGNVQPLTGNCQLRGGIDPGAEFRI